MSILKKILKTRSGSNFISEIAHDLTLNANDEGDDRTPDFEVSVGDANEIWLAVNIDNTDWTLRASHFDRLGRWRQETLYPVLQDMQDTYPLGGQSVPITTLYHGRIPNEENMETPESLEDARSIMLLRDFSFNILVDPTKEYTIRTKVIKVWRNYV